MKNLLLGTAAAVAIIAAPAGAPAQSQPMRGQTAAAGQPGAENERAKIDSLLDDASKMKGGDTRRGAAAGDRPGPVAAAAPDASKPEQPEKSTANADGDDRSRTAMDDRTSTRAAETSKSATDERSRPRSERSRSAAMSERSRSLDEARDRARVAVEPSDGGYDRRRSEARLAETDGGRRDAVRVEEGAWPSASAGGGQRSRIGQRVASEGGRRISRSTVGGAQVEAGAQAPRTVAIERAPRQVVGTAPSDDRDSVFQTDDGRIVIVRPPTYRAVYVVED